VRVVRNESNLGLTRSLRRGVELARGKYLARLDADDAALPNRLERQVNFLEQRREVAILGGGCVVVDESGKKTSVQRQPENDLAIRWTRLLTNPFTHSTVMLRRQVLVEHQLNYDAVFDTTQDYDLWTRLLRHGKGANLSTPLIRYRARSGVTQQKRHRQLEASRLIATRTIAEELPGYILTPQTMRSLLDSSYLDLRSHDDRDPNIAHLTKLRWDLYSAFTAKYATHPDLTKLRQWHSVQLVKYLWSAGLPPGWGKALAMVISKEPLTPGWVGRDYLREKARKNEAGE